MRNLFLLKILLVFGLSTLVSSQSTKPDTVEISFILVTEDNPIVFLRQALHSISSSMLKAEISFEVIISHIGTASFSRMEAIRSGLSLFGYTFINGQERDSPVVAYNRGVVPAVGKYLVFVDEMVELIDWMTIPKMRTLFDEGHQGVVGARLVFPDHTIYHAGIKPSTNLRKSDFWRGREFIGIEYPLQGYPDSHKVHDDTGLLVSKALMMTTKDVFNSAGQFSTDYKKSWFFDAHFCLMVQNASKSVKYLDSAIALYHGSGTPISTDKEFREELNQFDFYWGPQIRVKNQKTYELTNMTVYVNFACNSENVARTIETMNVVLSLYSKVRTILEVDEEEKCVNTLRQIGVPAYLIHVLADQMNLPSQTSFSNRVLLLLRPPNWWTSRLIGASSWDQPDGRNVLWTLKEFDYVIGFTTTGSKVTDQALKAYKHHLIDSIWTPSSFSQEILSKAGVNSSKIDKVSLPIDTHLFNQSTVKGPLFPAEKSTFTFLSIFQFSDSSDWRSLLDAFLEEFADQTEPKVKLIILSRMDKMSQTAFKDYIHQKAKERRDPSKIPQIEVLPFVPYSKMPELYVSADAFIRVSHFEELGTSFLEAMSMNIPTIGISYSSNLEFMTTKNSFLVNATYNQQKEKAEIDVQDLKAVMRKMISRRSWEGTSKMVNNKYSLSSVSSDIIQKLKDVKDKIPAAKALRKLVTPTPTPPSYPPTYSGSSYGSYSSYDSKKAPVPPGMKTIKILD